MLRELPFRILPTQPRRPAAGWMTSAAGWVLGFVLIGVWFLVFGFVGERYGEAAMAVAALAYGAPVFWLVPRCVRLIARGRRMRAPRAVDLLATDARPPVLFLRSFDDDDLVDTSFPTTNEIVPVRYESRLAAALHSLGPVIAIGRPNEPEPELGAARLYVDDADWQTAVEHFMTRAAVVVAVVGRSMGLWWEIEAATARVPLERLLLFFPYPAPREVRGSFWRAASLQNPVWGKWLRKRMYPRMEAERIERYRQFRARFAGSFAHPLPESPGDSLFLDFDRDGRPRLLPRTKPPLAVRVLTLNFNPRLDVRFARELRPFVAKLRDATAP